MDQDPKKPKTPNSPAENGEKNLKPESKPSVREIRIDVLKSYDPLQSSLAKMQADMLRSTEPMRKALEDVTKSLDFTKSALGAGLIPAADFLKQNPALTAAISGSSFCNIIPDSLTGSAISNLKHLFEPIKLVPDSTFQALSFAVQPPPGMSLLSDVIKQAMEPPPGLELFASSMQRFLEPSPGLTQFAELSARFTSPLAETNLVGDFWKQLNAQSELDWGPVLKLSATTSAITALKDWPNAPVLEPVGEETNEADDQIHSLDDARESVFATIEVGGLKPPHQVQQAFRFIYVLETEIRRFIHNVMVKHFGAGWEKQYLTQEMYESWSEKYQINVKNGGDPNMALIEFADFTDYVKLISRKSNWKVFEPFFKEKTHAIARFESLFPYRLHTMHGRTFAKDELLIIAGDCQWFLKRLGSSLLDKK